MVAQRDAVKPATDLHMTSLQTPSDAGADRFAKALRELCRIAEANEIGARLTLENFADHPNDPDATKMAASSVGYGLAQPAYLLRELQMLCLDLEMAAVTQRV